MDCRQAKDLLSAYLDNILDAPVRESLERHLSQCAGCREELEEIREMVKHVGSLKSMETPPDFLGTLHERIRTEKAGPKLKKTARFLFFPLQVKIPLEIIGFAAVAVIIFSVYQVMEPEKLVPTVKISEEKMDFPEQKAGPETRSAAKQGPDRNEMTVPEAEKSRKTDEPVKRMGVSPMGTKKPSGYGSRTVDLTMVLRAPVIINEEGSSTVAPSPAGNEMKEKDSAGLLKAAPGESPSATRAETHQAEREAPAEKKRGDDELASRVRDIIASVQGTLVSMENDEHGRLRLINATVAGNRLQDLHQRLESIAEMKPLPHSIVHSLHEEAPVKVIIRIEEKD